MIFNTEVLSKKCLNKYLLKYYLLIRVGFYTLGKSYGNKL